MHDNVPENVEPVLSGHLQRDEAEVPVRLGYASRTSLWVSFLSDQGFPDGTVFRALTLTTPGGPVTLSSCKLIVEYTRQGGNGRLAFLEDIYDCKCLMFEGKVVNLKTYFRNLPLVVGQKNDIRPAFREYVSDLTYDLSVYKRFFNEQDRILANEPAQVAQAGQEAILHSEGRAFMAFLDGQLKKLDEQVKDFSKEEHEKHGFYLRRQLWEYLIASAFLKRTNLKPRGYAGDAEMMMMTYENRYVGNYVFNKLLHKHPIESAAAQAVRNRRRLVPKVMRDTFARFPEASSPHLRVLSVACGPAWELQDLLLTPDDFQRIEVSLLDQDTHALDTAKEGLRRIESARDAKVKAVFHNESVRTMLRESDLVGRFGRYHFIYSMGLFDYLTPPVAKALLQKMYSLVEPGGCAVIGNYHMATPTRWYMAYWMDWVLYYRSEEEFLELGSGLGAKLSLTFDESRCQMFLVLEKPAA